MPVPRHALLSYSLLILVDLLGRRGFLPAATSSSLASLAWHITCLFACLAQSGMDCYSECFMPDISWCILVYPPQLGHPNIENTGACADADLTSSPTLHDRSSWTTDLLIYLQVLRERLSTHQLVRLTYQWAIKWWSLFSLFPGNHLQACHHVCYKRVSCMYDYKCWSPVWAWNLSWMLNWTKLEPSWHQTFSEPNILDLHKHPASIKDESVY